MVTIVIILFGLCMGSFVNALVFRLHKQSKQSTVHSPQSVAKNYALRTKDSHNLSIVSGRSMCPNCRHKLAWHDLLPLISWLLLKGHCRYCKKPISLQYPAVELSTAALFVVSYLSWHRPFTAARTTDLTFWLIICVILIALFVYDLKWMLLPNKLVYPLIVLSIVNVLTVNILDKNTGGLVWPFLGALILTGLFYILFQVSAGRWIGGGDVKLAIALGLLAGGVRLSVALLFLASLIGSLYALPLMALGRAKLQMKLPFGPLLIIGLIIVRLYGADLISWYNQMFLISP